MKKLLSVLLVFTWAGQCFAQNVPELKLMTTEVHAEPSASVTTQVDEFVDGVPLSADATEKPDVKESRAASRGNNLSASGLSPSRSIVKVIGALALVLLLIVCVAGLVKRAGITTLKRGKQLVLRESLSVGAKERLVVVDFAGESLLIGVASGKVNLVKSVPLLGFDSSELPAAHLGAKNALDFQHKLNEFLLKGQK